MAVRTTIRAAAGLALVAALCVGCAAASHPAPSGPWTVSVSTAGGFSGGGGTTMVLSDGTAYSERWQVAGGDIVRTPLGSVPPGELAELLEAVLDGELHATPEGQPANMTTSLVFAADGTRHVWYHEFQSEPAAPVGRAIQALEAAVQAAR